MSVKVCKCKCSRCGASFSKYSGRLINLSDSALQWFYKLPFVESYLKTHKHCILCKECLESMHEITVKDFKFKDGKWMTCNVCAIIKDLPNKTNVEKDRYILRVKELDDKGVLPYKGSETVKMFKDLSE